MTGPRAAGTPSGYSGTPLDRKLGIKAGHCVLSVNTPSGFPIDALDGAGSAQVLTRATMTGASASGTSASPASEPLLGEVDVLLLFCPDTATLTTQLPSALAVIAPKGRCWVAWPKKASRMVTDLTEQVVRETVLATGWVDVKVCAVDATWSGLCVMRRTRSAPR